MNKYKEIVFAALILFAPHIGLQLAVWMVCGMVVVAVLVSDAVANAFNRLLRSMRHYE